MKIISWNVNGIRACYKKGLVEFVRRERPDALCLQETKAHREQIEPVIFEGLPPICFWSSAVRKGYSGVATFLSSEPLEGRESLGIDHYDSEGRIVVTNHGAFDLYNIYFPNGGSGEKRHDFKQQFLKDVLNHFKSEIARGRELVVVGDYNVAHEDIDVYDPVKLGGESGFLPEEREWFGEFLKSGFVDTFRHFHPGEKEHFTWWDYRSFARVANRGWRIDYICVTQGLLSSVKKAGILDEIEGSDHCPIFIDLEV